MYPLIKAKLIRKAVSHFSQGLNDEEKDVIEAALEMQKFSMANTLIQFREKYYKYGEGGEDALERALTIGGYDSAWMADMVAGYILELANDHFDLARCFGIYGDDGNVVFEGCKSANELAGWLATFQSKVNEIVGSDDIKFTMDIWKPGQERRTVAPESQSGRHANIPLP